MGDRNMPNWCEGVIKIRGTKSNILKYLNEILEVPVSSYRLEKGLIKFDDIDEEYYSFEIQGRDVFYLKGTKRAFINSKEIIFCLISTECDKGETHIVTIGNFKQVWTIIPENYLELSKKYDVDLHIFGFEMGMKFTHEVEIHSGQLIKNRALKYEDYTWEVPFSDLGG
ncbi:hypothetical protein [Streptococcus agalactiae]|uniref:hypothetical protein n=2 Tax=Streptococcus agalactiae TaxID=1311 RepID=UPI00210ACF90|nr:hypothetical protein [Streptococcus agalactiae]